MINSLISLHSYFLLNGAIVVSYIIVRAVHALPFLKQKISQSQQLKFSRHSFLSIIAVFFIMPSLIAIVPATYYSNFQLGPILKNVSMTFLQNQDIVNAQLNSIGSTHGFLSINIILIIIFLLGTSILFAKYIKNILALKKIQHNSFCRHKINNIHLLFSHLTEAPFCWSFWQNHFVTIPISFLEKNEDLKLAIHHELQHIRQGDTYWLHFLSIIKIFCFWNPFIKLWINWLEELQEFSCDEAIMLRNKTSSIVYAQCLINAAANRLKSGLVPQGTLGINKLSKSILYRRVNMLFNYANFKKRKLSILLAYAFTFLSAISAAYAFTGTSSTTPLTTQQVATIINQSHLDKSFQISATPEVVSEINNIRASKQARAFMQESLHRMKQYQPIITEALQKDAMPNELLAVPLVESGYQPLEQSKNPVLAAGIWQIIPTTGKWLGLNVDPKQDDRLNTQLATTAALKYLKLNHQQFNSWKLAVIAYEYGEPGTEQLINTVGSRDAWVLARSPAAFKNLKQFIAMFDAAVIIINNPSLIA